MLTVGSLFAGIGGFDLGFERAGMKVVWQVEIDSYCQKVLARHFPDAERFGDIRECGKHNLRAVDVLCGGFPCQDVSEVGARAGLGGDKSGLWSEMRRIIGELRPGFVIVENVSGLLNRGMATVLGDLVRLRYDAEWGVLSACRFGAPHTRQRMFLVAYPDSGRQEASRQSGNGNGHAMVAWGQMQQHLHSAALPGSGNLREAWSREPRLPRMDDGIPNRIYRNAGLGNAIVPQIAEWIGRRIVAVAAPKQVSLISNSKGE